jgi:hypothetical protein
MSHSLPSVASFTRGLPVSLVEQRGANTSDWDFASTCTVDGQKGLVLIEAKAYAAELDIKGKSNSGGKSASADLDTAASVSAARSHLHLKPH